MEMINRFGSGEIYTIDDIVAEQEAFGMPLIYCTSTACMSVTSDMMSWASKYLNNKVTFTSKNGKGYNNVIIVLGCQVTHLAIQNDIDTAERLHNENPDATVYMGGCLAMRFDIELPNYIKRLAVTREKYTPITEQAKNFIHWEKPFWVNNWNESDADLADGHIFRNMYPLKIGAGCHGKCKYCTIRDTRGESYEADAFLQVKEFLDNDNVVLISDSPTVKQINDWRYLAIRYNKPISIRNVEPPITCACEDILKQLAEKNLLKIYHCPIQHSNPDVIKAMGRDPFTTEKAISIMQELRKMGVIVATNIIINYTVDNNGVQVGVENPILDWLNSNFDYWSWNPYFNQDFTSDRARRDFKYYISDNRGIQDILNKVELQG